MTSSYSPHLVAQAPSNPATWPPTGPTPRCTTPIPASTVATESPLSPLRRHQAHPSHGTHPTTGTSRPTWLTRLTVRPGHWQSDPPKHPLHLAHPALPCAPGHTSNPTYPDTHSTHTRVCQSPGHLAEGSPAGGVQETQKSHDTQKTQNNTQKNTKTLTQKKHKKIHTHTKNKNNNTKNTQKNITHTHTHKKQQQKHQPKTRKKKGKHTATQQQKQQQKKQQRSSKSRSKAAKAAKQQRHSSKVTKAPANSKSSSKAAKAKQPSKATKQQSSKSNSKGVKSAANSSSSRCGTQQELPARQKKKRFRTAASARAQREPSHRQKNGFWHPREKKVSGIHAKKNRRNAKKNGPKKTDIRLPKKTTPPRPVGSPIRLTLPTFALPTRRTQLNWFTLLTKFTSVTQPPGHLRRVLVVDELRWELWCNQVMDTIPACALPARYGCGKTCGVLATPNRNNSGWNLRFRERVIPWRSLHLNVKRSSGRAEEESVIQNVSSKSVQRQLAADVVASDRRTVRSSRARAGLRSPRVGVPQKFVFKENACDRSDGA